MKMSSVLRTALVALVAFAAASLSQARADEGFATQTICKAGWIIDGSGGSGVLNFRGRSYPLSTGASGGADGECGSERAGDYDEVGVA
jgi:lipid-binding SYLF domain-containing protein